MNNERDNGESVVTYLCNECKTTQNVIFTPIMNQEFILDDPEFQASGLALYSHMHVCKFGILGVNSLFIDHNLHVRSYNYVNLPKYKIKTKVSIPMPGAPKSDEGATSTLRVTHVRDKN